jgi:hypothetical protein
MERRRAFSGAVGRAVGAILSMVAPNASTVTNTF